MKDTEFIFVLTILILVAEHMFSVSENPFNGLNYCSESHIAVQKN